MWGSEIFLQMQYGQMFAEQQDWTGDEKSWKLRPLTEGKYMVGLRIKEVHVGKTEISNSDGGETIMVSTKMNMDFVVLS